MKQVRALITLAIILPFAALANGLSAADAGSLDTGSTTVSSAPGGSYDCCWVFMSGKWYCVPC